MSGKYIPVGEAAKDWMKNAAFREAYDGLEEGFALAAALIKARGSDLTQAQVAEAIGTTQAFVARLESGRGMKSTRSLKKFARATGTRLRIGFERGRPARGDGAGRRFASAPQEPASVL